MGYGVLCFGSLVAFVECGVWSEERWGMGFKMMMDGYDTIALLAMI